MSQRAARALRPYVHLSRSRRDRSAPTTRRHASVICNLESLISAEKTRGKPRTERERAGVRQNVPSDAGNSFSSSLPREFAPSSPSPPPCPAVLPKRNRKKRNAAERSTLSVPDRDRVGRHHPTFDRFDLFIRRRRGRRSSDVGRSSHLAPKDLWRKSRGSDTRDESFPRGFSRAPHVRHVRDRSHLAVVIARECSTDLTGLPRQDTAARLSTMTYEDLTRGRVSAYMIAIYLCSLARVWIFEPRSRARARSRSARIPHQPRTGQGLRCDATLSCSDLEITIL